MKQFIIVLILLAPAFNFAQSGFFGKKNIVEANIHGNIPVIYNLRLKIFESSGGHQSNKGDLNNRLNWLNYGFSFQDFHYFSNRFGLGLEFALNFQKAAVGNAAFYYSDDVIVEDLSLNTISIMPKIEIGSLNGILPMGLSHQLGIGYTSTKIVNKNYLLKEADVVLTNNHIEEIGWKLLDFSKKHKGFSLMYQMNYRLPINKFLFLNYGFRYSINVTNVLSVFDDIYEQNIPDSQLIDDYSTRSIVHRARISNFVQFTIGLGFAY